MPRYIKPAHLWITALFLAIVAISTGARAQTATPEPFDAMRAFCERQTFALDSIDEVDPWLNYFSGLRNGRSPTPDTQCQSNTVRSIINIVSSSNIETAEALRSGFFRFYVARAMEPELADRRTDTDGSFRYRNDIVLAGFVWLLCPGHGDQRTSCVKGIIRDFPAGFTQTSPVFCDFAEPGDAKIEWPPRREAHPLVCAADASAKSDSTKAWLRQAEISLGD